MSDSNEEVTPNVTGDSRHPVPTRPDPTRPALYIDRGDFPSCRPVGDARATSDAMMLRGLDFDPTCSTNACHANPNPAAYAIRWVRHLQPSLGHHVWFICDPCWREGLAVMTACPAGVMWRVVEVLR